MPPNFLYSVKLLCFAIVVTLAAREGKARTLDADPNSGTVGFCQVAVNVQATDLAPANQLHDYFLPMQVVGPTEEIDAANATVDILQPPARGKIGRAPTYSYKPNAGFLGKDFVAFRVRVRANKELVDYEVQFFIHVVPPMSPTHLNREMERLCPSPGAWRVR